MREYGLVFGTPGSGRGPCRLPALLLYVTVVPCCLSRARSAVQVVQPCGCPIVGTGWPVTRHQDFQQPSAE